MKKYLITRTNRKYSTHKWWTGAFWSPQSEYAAIFASRDVAHAIAHRLGKRARVIEVG